MPDNIEGEPGYPTAGSAADGRDPAEVVIAVTGRMAEINVELLRLAEERRAAIAVLHEAGYSYAEIAALAGLSRGRVHQLLH